MGSHSQPKGKKHFLKIDAPEDQTDDVCPGLSRSRPCVAGKPATSGRRRGRLVHVLRYKAALHISRSNSLSCCEDQQVAVFTCEARRTGEKKTRESTTVFFCHSPRWAGSAARQSSARKSSFCPTRWPSSWSGSRLRCTCRRENLRMKEGKVTEHVTRDCSRAAVTNWIAELTVVAFKRLETKTDTRLKKEKKILLYPFLNDGTDGADPVVLVAGSCWKEQNQWWSIYKIDFIIFSKMRMTELTNTK